MACFIITTYDVLGIYFALIADELDGVDEDNAERLAGVLDSTYLFAYAFFMFVRLK